MADEISVASRNGIALLWDELVKRFLAPMPHVSFWVFLIVGVVIYGGLPVWLELYLYCAGGATVTSEHLRVALTTFSPALVGAISTQLIFEEAGRDKRMMAFAILVVPIFLFAATILTLVTAMKNEVAIPCAILFCLLSILVWWIANGFNRAFQDDFKNDAPVGGPTTNEPTGDLNGFNL
jgi:hypothetical protein